MFKNQIRNRFKMLKLFLICAVLGYSSHVMGAPAFNNNMMSSPAMRAIMDMLHKFLNQKVMSNMPPKLTKPMPPPPMAPMPAFNPPQPPPQRPSPPATGNNGLFMNLPAGGMNAGYGMNYVYCPPGPTSSDSCKEQKLNEALYLPNGTPRYDWVPPRNPWDSSIPDNVKDTARNILMMKVNSRRNRMMSPKEQEILSYL